jgi:hypothetical protein
MDNNISANIVFNANGDSADITPTTDIFELNLQLYKEKGKKVGNIEDPDDSNISKKIYETIFPFYDDDFCRGETLNTYNSTFGTDNDYKLLETIKKEPISEDCKNTILSKAKNFKHIYCSIGNFTVLDRGKPNSINCSRGINSLHDSWPLTLLCIQDYLNGFSNIKNPLKETFETSETTIKYFNHYKNINNGFEKFCDDQYLSPKCYGNEPQFSYVDELPNGKYKVKLDLFDGLDFSKPLAETIIEMEQYIDRATNKIIKRGEIILNEYLKALQNRK